MPTAAGFLYLAVVLDAWSRKLIGWSMANHRRTELVLDTLDAAIGQRRPRDVIHHSDQGSQLAMCESFFATLECELPERRRPTFQAEARIAVFSFIEGWYNPVRLHSALGYRSPINYEEQCRRLR